MDLLRMFVAGATARVTSEIVGVQRNIASSFFMCLRRLIAGKLLSYELSGELEADESCFGGTRKGERGRGAFGKVAVFGLLKSAGKVFTAIVSNARTETLLPTIEERVTPDSIVYIDTFKAYNALENFWNQANRHLRKFNGINKDSFTGF